MKYKYSFIIPHKNCPELLGRCIKSIPERDDIEIIIVDDNSDVGKKPVLKRENVIVVELSATESKGAGHARNVGIKAANGRWLLFADCDDYYKDGFIDELDEYCLEDKSVVYFGTEYRDGVTGEILPEIIFMKKIREYRTGSEDIDYIRYYNNPPWNKMVSRKFVDNNNIHFEESFNGNDIFFSLSIGAKAVNTEVIRKPLYVYLKNQGSLSTTDNIDALMCRITHVIKTNNIYKSINHPDWQCSLWKAVAIQTKRARGITKIKFILTLLSKFLSLYRKRDEWTKQLINRTAQ